MILQTAEPQNHNLLFAHYARALFGKEIYLNHNLAPNYKIISYSSSLQNISDKISALSIFPGIIRYKSLLIRQVIRMWIVSFRHILSNYIHVHLYSLLQLE